MSVPTVAALSLLIAFGCTLIVLVDLTRTGGQKMAVMNVVWPLTTLYAGPLGLWFYWRAGRLSSRARLRADRDAGRQPTAERKPRWQMTALAATHCGAGCTLGDVIVESFVFFVPVAIAGSKLVGTWTLDFAAAFLLGIVFQFFTIAPMRGLGLRDGIIAALKADTLSLTAWQVGMYGGMAILSFGLTGHELPRNSPTFWGAMQLAMLAGFATSYPVNAWLLARGWKERM